MGSESKMKHHVVFAISLFLGMAGVTRSETLNEIIDRAGNAPTEEARLQALDDLQRIADLPTPLAQDAERLEVEIRRYLTEQDLDYFGRTVYQTNDYDFGVDKASPLHSLTHLYRARMLIW